MKFFVGALTKRTLPLVIGAAIVLFTSFAGLAQDRTAPNPPEEQNSESWRLIQVTWLDLAFINFFPVSGSRLADFSDYNVGAATRLHFMLFNFKPLWLSAIFMTDWNKTNSHRLDRIIDISFAVGVGWRFGLPMGFFVTPRFSYGLMIHETYGDYYNDPQIYPNDPRAGKKQGIIFTDQYFHYEVEIAYSLTPYLKSAECEVFLSPSFIHYAEKKRQGLELGYMIGVRLKIDSMFSKSTAPDAVIPPAVLSGKVIDEETGKDLKDTMPVVYGTKAETAPLSAGETFAFFTEPGEDCVLKAEREGYVPVSLDVDGARLLSDKRHFVVLPMKLSRVWGIFGYVYDKDSNDPLRNVAVTVTDSAGNKKELTTPRSGDFRMELEKETDYDILLKKNGYFTVRGNFTTKGRNPGWYDVKNFMETSFQKAVRGAIVEFGNIYFDSGRWDIRKDSVPGLDRMVQFMTDNPGLIMELGAHTDSLGDAAPNMTLSEKRAQSAVDYIIGKGIAVSRISAKGYGETKIKNQCKDGVFCSQKDHQVNRRIELMVKDIESE